MNKNDNCLVFNLRQNEFGSLEFISGGGGYWTVKSIHVFRTCYAPFDNI